MSLFKRKPWTGKTELLFSDKALTALILPLFLEQLLSVFVGLSDSIMVAQVGEAAVSAVSLVDSIAILQCTGNRRSCCFGTISWCQR